MKSEPTSVNYVTSPVRYPLRGQFTYGMRSCGIQAFYAQLACHFPYSLAAHYRNAGVYKERHLTFLPAQASVVEMDSERLLRVLG